jgi:two-component system, chemotaxis family, CheB/CheR fusion protein
MDGKAVRMLDRNRSLGPVPSFSSQFVPTNEDIFSDLPQEADMLQSDFADGKAALIVDDVADVTEMLAVLLSHAGFEVVTAISARAGLEAARQRRFDVIISDIGMPEMNGYQLAREIREIPGYETVPMVAVTGYSMFDDKERSQNAGFNAHLTKPIDPRALLDLIEQL